MKPDPEVARIPVGISHCLLGERVRYDGGHRHDAFITGTLGRIFTFEPFCPEVGIGLGVPRPPVRLVADGETLRCLGVADPELDVTDRLQHYADTQQSHQAGLCGYIFKQRSPSCGVAAVPVWRDGREVPDGTGLYAARVMHHFPALPVTEEGWLGDAQVRENFIERVFVYRRWQRLVRTGPGHAAIQAFHAAHKYILMSHDPEQARMLGRWLATAAGMDAETLCSEYPARLMRVLEVVATREKQVNVLQHIQGYLKERLDPAGRQALNESIEQYRVGKVPRRVPLTRLRECFADHPDAFITNSLYLNPPPEDVALLNRL